MKTVIKSLAIALLLATSAQAKSHVLYDVCAVEGGKLAVYAKFDKRAKASAIADYLEQKNGRHFYVVLEEVSDNEADGTK